MEDKKVNKVDESERLVAEFIKCKRSFHYFCSHHVYIALPGGDELLIPYVPQRDLIDWLELKKYVLVLKSRQIGISTIVQAYICWLCTFYTNVVIGIISKDASEATSFARTIMSMIDKLPIWMKPKFVKRTEQTFILSTGAQCYASPVNPVEPEKTLRGKAITFLVIDEAAFVRNIDTAWTGMIPALSTNQMMAKKKSIPYGTVLLSTPNKTVGIGKWFFERYSSAISGDDIFHPFVIHWKDVSELAGNPEWYDVQCRLFNHDNRKIQQELELKFLPSSGSFFEETTIQTLQDNKKQPIERFKLFNGEIWVFIPPIEGRHYIIGVDTAPEHGLDKSAITVWDYETIEQVWEYQGKCAVLDFVKVLKYCCAQYKGTVVIESNSYGNQVVEEMRASEYSHYLYKEKRGVDRLLYGLSTTSKTRPLMIDALYSYISEFPETVKSERMILELTGLVTKSSGRVEADMGCHDDLAMSAAMAFYVRKWDPPLMVDSSRFSATQFDDIMRLNEGLDRPTFNNSSIIKSVRKKIDKMELEDNVINTLDFFTG